MVRLTIALIVTFLGNFIYADTIILSRQVSTTVSTTKQCKTAADCPYSDICIICDDGYGPNCETPTCINGQCGLIKRCSQQTSTTTSTDYQCQDSSRCVYPAYCALECPGGYGPLCATGKCIEKRCQIIKPCSQKTQCTEKDLSQCIAPGLCALCNEGYSPDCAKATCEDGQCKIIQPCSIHGSLSSSSSSSTTISVYQCQNDGDCSYVKQCVKECPNGSTPLCAFGSCVKGNCVITSPCSQKSQCTEKDLSQCIVPAICALCKEGYSPDCAKATCEDGQCKIIQPCSIYTQPSTDVCTSDSQCPRSKICALECKNGTTPRCASAKCVDGKCISIKPCSQFICKKAATCPYNKLNCKRCSKNYGPTCEQPACSGGICSVILPCSKNLLITPINSITN